MIINHQNCKEEATKIIKEMLKEGTGNPSVNWYSDQLKENIINNINSSDPEIISETIFLLRGEEGLSVMNQRYDQFMRQNHENFKKDDGEPATRNDVLAKYIEFSRQSFLAPNYSPHLMADSTSKMLSQQDRQI